MKTKYLHTMVRVKNLEASIAFYELLGLKKIRHYDSEKGRFSLIFMAPEGQEESPDAVAYIWDGDDGLPLSLHRGARPPDAVARGHRRRRIPAAGAAARGSGNELRRAHESAAAGGGQPLRRGRAERAGAR